MRSATLPCALLAVLLAAPAAQALPSAASSLAAAASGAAKRSHAKAIDEDSESEEAPPARSAEEDDAPRRKSRPADDEDEAPRRRAAEDDEESPGPAPAKARHHRTAEEEMGEESRDSAEERLSGLDEPGQGMASGVVTGLMFLDGPTGSVTTFAMGIDFLANVGRHFFPPEDEFLHNGLYAEFSYLYTWFSDGTTGGGGVPTNGQVKVRSSLHDLSLAALVGYPLPHVFLYGKLGPVLFFEPVSMSVEGTDTSFTGVKGGLVYGVGARTEFFLTDQVGANLGFELSRFRRSYLNDTMAIFHLDIAF